MRSKRVEMSLQGKKILLGVTGGIAAYKSVHLLRLLKTKGAQVQVILTPAACEFVTPLTFETLSERKVYVHMFERGRAEGGTSPVEHIELSKWPDMAVVAPATANTISKLAHGRTSDLLSAVLSAFTGTVVLAPAMNEKMWENDLVRENLRSLSDRGFRVIPPEEGELACGDEGKGRMAEPEDIVRFIERIYGGLYSGLRVLVSAGRTEEDLDPVRFISNRSSGRMGFALAEAVRDQGGEVTVVAGRTDIAPPEGVKLVRVRTGQEMARALDEEFSRAHVLFMVAAVSDFKPKSPLATKQKGGNWTLELAETTDILASLGGRKGDRFIVGFALETEEMESNALRKLEEKKCDLIVANNPLQEGAGFGLSTNAVTVYGPVGEIASTGVLTKREVAERILEIAATQKRFKELKQTTGAG